MDLAELANAHTVDTDHIDDALVEVALANATDLAVVPDEGMELELIRPVRRPPVGSPVPLWARLAADPGFAAEHAAREAVDRLGPAVRDWLRRTGARYPTATRDGLARLATMDAVRLGRREGTTSGAGGLFGTTVASALLGHDHARLVLTIAATYGFDPTARERAHELLVILRVPRLTQPTGAAVRNTGRLIASIAVRRAAARLMPFGAAIVGATIGARSTRDIADRAIAFYRTAADTSDLRK